MIRILRADMARLRKSTSFRLSLLGMLVLSILFMIMQATGMDYTVPLSRVIFLPMSMYGVAMAAFISVFVGTDFNDGFIRNKLLAAEHRCNLVVSQIIVSCMGCLIIYIAITVFTAVVGRFFFEDNVNQAVFFRYFILGIGMSLVTGCIFSVITMLCGSKTTAILWCMGLAFGMLFLCLHTNEILVQTAYKNGAPNPRYVSGFRRELCGILHDLNPCGQAAQLSGWEVWHPVRELLFNCILIIGLPTVCCMLFRRKDIY